jgi:hypothetical protein
MARTLGPRPLWSLERTRAEDIAHRCPISSCQGITGLGYGSRALAAKRDHDRLDSWLQRFARAWEERDPDGAAALFSDATRLELDGILLLSLNDDGRCEDFREWSNRRLVAAPPATG